MERAMVIGGVVLGVVHLVLVVWLLATVRVMDLPERPGVEEVWM